MTSVMSFSISARRPRAPVLRASAVFASAFSAAGSNESSTPSIASSFWYCLTSEFFGSVRIRTRSSSERSFIVVMTGRRPVNSGMRPNFTRSSGRTSCGLISFAFAESAAALSGAPKPIACASLRAATILSRPTNAPPQMKRMFDVSTSMYSWSGCLRPPFGGMRQIVPSTSFSSVCCTPSPPTSRVMDTLSVFEAILSISST